MIANGRSGGVTSGATIADHALVRGDGGARGIQDSGITVDDSDNITGVGTVDGVTISTHDHSGAGQGGTVDHTDLSTIGTNSHADIDTHITDTTNPHSTDIGNLGSGTLAELNTAVTDATLDDSGDSRPPSGAAGGDLGGTYPNPTVDDGADSTAIHDNVAAEINAIAEKTAPLAADLVVIEDSADSNNKKKVQVGNLAGLVPVGGVVAWLKSYTNTPALSSNYVECNGQVLSDAGSVYNGQTIPNLNGSGGTKRFLRGSTTSGATGGTGCHTHTYGGCFTSYSPSTTVQAAAPPTTVTAAGQYHTHVTRVSGTTGGVYYLPDYYEVVWVVRVK